MAMFYLKSTIELIFKSLVLSFAHLSGLIVALIKIVRCEALRTQKELYVVVCIFVSILLLKNLE